MNQTNVKERGISILVSLLFHAFMLYLLVKVVPPVRVYLYRQVAEIQILSPEMLYVPQIQGEVALEGLSDRRGAIMPQVEPDPGTVYLRNLDPGRDTDKSIYSPDNYGAIPRFDLLPLPKKEGSFSLGISREESEHGEITENEVRERPDFSKYYSPALESLRFSRVMTRKGERIPSAQLSRNEFSQLGGYDIAPWVKEVVDRIRDNWDLPPIEESIAIGEVKIFIVIGKQGNLVALEVLKSSDFPVFDRTTTEAIRSSAPFPPLPDDFPLARLEAFLVFQFNE